jgi:septum formation protein
MEKECPGIALHPVFTARLPLVLASASPRRREFLRGLGIEHTVVPPPGTAEPLPVPGEEPAAFAARAAAAKARAVSALMPEAAVLGADTVVALDGAVLGKPRDAEDAFWFLKRLAGRDHTVITACALCLPGGEAVEFAARAAVTMAVWPDAVLRAYARCGEGLDKAGGYALQGAGAFLVTAVRGSWSAVVGLPAAETVAACMRHGIVAAP